MIELAIDALAAGRLARLVTTDKITAPIREALIEGSYFPDDAAEIAELAPHDTWTQRVLDDPNAPMLGYVLACPWCSAVWIAAGVVVARKIAPRWWRRVAVMLATAEVAGRLASS